MPRMEHRTKNGDQVPGVTTVLKNLGWSLEPLKWWAWKLGKEGKDLRSAYKKEANAGTIAHYLIDCDFKKTTPNVAFDFPLASPESEKKAQTSFMNYLNWKKNLKLNPVASEIELVSESWRFGGRIDRIAKVSGSLAIIDWKTGKDIYADQIIQISAYGRLWEENHPDQLLEGGYHLLNIEKETAAFHHHHWVSLEDYFEVFKLLLGIEKYRKTLGK